MVDNCIKSCLDKDLQFPVGSVLFNILHVGETLCIGRLRRRREWKTHTYCLGVLLGNMLSFLKVDVKRHETIVGPLTAHSNRYVTSSLPSAKG